MKKFEIPEYYRSSIISQVKALRKANDSRKKDFSPTILDLGKIRLIISRHFGFCYGVENAIEIAYKAICENPDKRIFLLSQMIHNPGVNEDLIRNGVRFLQDTSGNQLISWDELSVEDIVIVPAFGTTVEIENRLIQKGIQVSKYNTTCPFVEKVWNRSETLGKNKHTIIIHGKHSHEETRATFSHSQLNAPSLILKDIKDASKLADFILGKLSIDDFAIYFKGKFSENFNPSLDLEKIGIVNQTTMLASETQEITDFLRATMLQKYGEENLKEHIADTRDTLCYATNDNQTATLGLMEEKADFALIIGGYNSSNTTHLVELLEQKFPSYFINNHENIISANEINSFNIHFKKIEKISNFTPEKEQISIVLTSGASCPDILVDEVIQKLISIYGITIDIEEVISNLA
ncbi:MAG: 4-hydroxy-3-methylbut-2-enyl diphosphate reductase [Flavobacteriia bacterium]|nr:4-hydroxy-3-methylbut-2-enyl diphosphate reductase [Flavobacteriia bacterium]